MKQKSRGYYTGALREIGVLIVVFGPLSSFFEADYAGIKLAEYVLYSFLLGLIFFQAGVFFERGN